MAALATYDPEPENENDPGEEFEPAWGEEPEFTPDAFTPVATGAND